MYPPCYDHRVEFGTIAVVEGAKGFDELVSAWNVLDGEERPDLLDGGCECGDFTGFPADMCIDDCVHGAILVHHRLLGTRQFSRTETCLSSPSIMTATMTWFSSGWWRTTADIAFPGPRTRLHGVPGFQRGEVAAAASAPCSALWRASTRPWRHGVGLPSMARSWKTPGAYRIGC